MENWEEEIARLKSDRVDLQNRLAEIKGLLRQELNEQYIRIVQAWILAVVSQVTHRPAPGMEEPDGAYTVKP